MKLINDLFEVIESSDSEASFVTTIKLNAGHLIYSGHFPGHPVTPGVIQLQIVHELLEKHFCKNLKLLTLFQCKFLKILNPNETSRLVVYIEFNCVGDLLNIKARGENGTTIFFKMDSTYQFI
ncbi:MAG: 3-hydroxyacyl-ACP dehydratase [Chitinophagaceae bacterium]